MNTNQTIAVLKAFYFGSDSITAIARRTQLSRDEVREALRGARECGLIKYSTKDYNETFVHKDSKKLGEYLKAKGLISENRRGAGHKNAPEKGNPRNHKIGYRVNK